jgi:hypothetical protein
MEGKMMLTSYGETSGFKAVDSGELELINGGKTGGGGGGGNAKSNMPVVAPPPLSNSMPVVKPPITPGPISQNA